jgi:hypothetical protein
VTFLEPGVQVAPPADARDGQWPRNPLIAAVVWQLPQSGPFSAEQRSAWLKMMATAFDVAYGPVEGSSLFASSNEGAKSYAAAAAPAAPARIAHAGHGFYISADGTACSVNGEPALMMDIPAEEMIFDYRPVTGDFRDTASILWADGERGIKGIAAGVSFCGPG